MVEASLNLIVVFGIFMVGFHVGRGWSDFSEFWRDLRRAVREQREQDEKFREAFRDDTDP